MATFFGASSRQSPTLVEISAYTKWYYAVWYNLYASRFSHSRKNGLQKRYSPFSLR